MISASIIFAQNQINLFFKILRLLLIINRSAPIESKVDAAEWQLEVERVSTFLQMPKATEKDWRSHLETIAAHHKIIVEHMTETKTNLDKMNSEIGSTLEKVDTRERFINEKFQHLVRFLLVN